MVDEVTLVINPLLLITPTIVKFYGAKMMCMSVYVCTGKGTLLLHWGSHSELL